MGKEIDLMTDYPKAKRDIEGRVAGKTDEDRRIARMFGKDFLTATGGAVTAAITITRDSGNR